MQFVLSGNVNVFRTDSDELGNKNCAPAVASSGPAAMPSISGGSRSATLPRNRSADAHSLRTDSDGAESTMERSLALLTAQYEKNNRNSINSQVSRRRYFCGRPRTTCPQDFFFKSSFLSSHPEPEPLWLCWMIWVNF